jgi:hypothetical protein
MVIAPRSDVLTSKSVAAALVLAGLGWGCGDDTSATATASGAQGSASGTGGASTASGATSSSGSSMGGQGTGGVPEGYPPPPYGNAEGETFPYLVWAGRVNDNSEQLATAAPWVDSYTSDDLRTSGAPYALVHTALAT